MNGQIVAAASAETFIVKHGIVENLKAEALELAKLYSGNLQVQVDIKQDSGVALLRITEYNV